MKALRRFLSRLSGSTTSRHDEARLREELEAHLQMQAAENVRAGLSPEEARRQAVLKFGPIEAIKGSYRDEQRLPVVDDFLQDVRYACRQLRKAPLFTLTAILSLAMGIGANAAVFTVVERVLLRPLPVSKPHELVYIDGRTNPDAVQPAVLIPALRGLAGDERPGRRGGTLCPWAERVGERTDRESQRRARLRQLLQRLRRGHGDRPASFTGG